MESNSLVRDYPKIGEFKRNNFIGSRESLENNIRFMVLFTSTGCFLFLKRWIARSRQFSRLVSEIIHLIVR